MGYPYMTPGMPPAAGYAVQSPYYGYPQANTYAAANAYGQQSGSSGAGGGKCGRLRRLRRRRPTVQLLSAPALPRAAEQWHGNDSSQFNYYGNYGQSAYGR